MSKRAVVGCVVDMFTKMIYSPRLNDLDRRYSNK